MKQKTNGFTLIELMVVVAIIGILSAIAYPSYTNSVTKSRRSDATGALQGFANAMERRFTESNSYCDVGGASSAGANNNSTGAHNCGDAGRNDTGYPIIFATRSPIDGGTKYYDLKIHAVTATTYTLRAEPISGTAQVNNGFLELTSTGKRSWDKDNNNTIASPAEETWD